MDNGPDLQSDRHNVSRRDAMTGVAAVLVGGLEARPIQEAFADAFVESVGLCVHLASEAYAKMFNEVLRFTRNLCVRHFRDDMRPTDDLQRWRRLHRETGVRAHLLVSPSTNTVGEMVDYVGTLGPAIVSAIEGQNEGDGWFRNQPSSKPDWARAVIDYQRACFTAARKNFGALPVVSPSVLDYRPEDMSKLREAAQYCDVVALHAYVQGQQHPETSDAFASLGWYLREIRDQFKPGAPAMITEAGYRTGPTGVSPRAAAIYLPRLLLNAFDRGVVRSFLYEMLDEGGDANDSEQNYGLVHANGTPKPAYHTLQTLLSALSDPGPAFTPSPIKMELRTTTADLRCCVFAKRNGTHVVAIWRALPIWDKASRRDLPLRPVRATIALDRTPAQVSAREIWPTIPWRTASPRSEMVVPVSEMVTLLRIAS